MTNLMPIIIIAFSASYSRLATDALCYVYVLLKLHRFILPFIDKYDLTHGASIRSLRLALFVIETISILFVLFA